ncbi:hypothetical protein ABK040_003471 [Willaertia magna]
MKRIVEKRKEISKRIYRRTIIRKKEIGQVLLMIFKNILTRHTLKKLKESTEKLQFKGKKLRYSYRFIDHYSFLIFLANNIFLQSLQGWKKYNRHYFITIKMLLQENFKEFNEKLENLKLPFIFDGYSSVSINKSNFKGLHKDNCDCVSSISALTIIT